MPPRHLHRGSASRGMVAILLAVVALVAGVGPAFAQAAPAATSGTPVPHRPKIGLVLSGGGARGLTHVGVLQVLEEMRIPVDYITATSMGAIVGGLFAAGISTDEMKRQLATVDWSSMFSDSPPRADLNLRRKDEEARYPIPLELGFRDGSVRVSKGALAGGNLETYLHELTRSADNLRNFDQLPTPFRAVATDMVTGREVVFDGGPLYLALRASMSVPGVFAPLEVGDRIYGDGGLVDNLPVALVKKLGADVVIAVNIGTPLMARDQLSSLVGLTAQSINILTQQNVRASLALLGPDDVLISPELGRLTFLDFYAAKTFIELGDAATRHHASELSRYALPPDEYRAWLAERHPLPPAPDPQIASVRITGTERDNPDVLETEIKSKPGTVFSTAKVDADVSRLYGTGDFERVSYRLIDERGQRDLVFDVTEKSWGPNFLRFGVNLSSDLQGETFFNFLLGHKRTWMNSLGGQWANELEFGQIRRYSTEWYQPLEKTQSIFGSLYGEVRRQPQYIYDGNARVAEYDILTTEAGADLGIQFGSYGELRVGPRLSHYRADPTIAARTFPVVHLREHGVGATLRWDRLDDPFFATSGLRANVDLFRGLPGLHSQTDVSRGSADFLQALSVGSNDFVHFAGRFGASNRRDTTLATDYELGGFLNVSGLRTNQRNGDYLGFGRAVWYHRMGALPVVGRSYYVGGSLELGNVWTTRSDVSFGNVYKAGSVFLAADTYLGPLYVAWGHTNKGDSSWYLFLGLP